MSVSVKSVPPNDMGSRAGHGIRGYRRPKTQQTELEFEFHHHDLHRDFPSRWPLSRNFRFPSTKKFRSKKPHFSVAEHSGDVVDTYVVRATKADLFCIQKKGLIDGLSTFADFFKCSICYSMFLKAAKRARFFCFDRVPPKLCEHRVLCTGCNSNQSFLPRPLVVERKLFSFHFLKQVHFFHCAKEGQRLTHVPLS